MKIFKELNKLGYKHYTEHTVEELDDLPLDSKEIIMEQALVLRWFREKYNIISYIRWNKSYKPISFEWVIESESFGGETHCKKDWTYEEAEIECLRELIKMIKEC